MDDRILVVDDDESLRDVVCKVLRRAGYLTDAVATVDEAWERLEGEEYAVVVTDKNMPGRDEGDQEGGMALLRHVKGRSPSTEVIMMTGYATVETAIEAMRMGAFDYLIKPFRTEELTVKVERILSCKSFLNPERALRMHRIFHHHVVKLIEHRGEGDDEAMLESMAALEESIDGVLTLQKEWERIILFQREALSMISAQAEQLRESIDTGAPSIELLDEILDLSYKRL